MTWRDQRSGRRSREPVRGGAPRRSAGTRGVAIAVNLAPMIDVSFLLLIFFLVTSTFERAEGILSSKLPHNAGAPAVALPISPIVVRLTQVGVGQDDYRIKIDHFDSQPTNTTELAGHLREIQQQPGFDAQTPVLIVPDNDVRWDHVIGCWNAAIRAGCQRVAFSEP